MLDSLLGPFVFGQGFLLDSLLRVLVFSTGSCWIHSLGLSPSVVHSGNGFSLDSLHAVFVLGKRFLLDSLVRVSSFRKVRVLVFGESCVLDSLLGVFEWVKGYRWIHSLGGIVVVGGVGRTKLRPKEKKCI